MNFNDISGAPISDAEMKTLFPRAAHRHPGIFDPVETAVRVTLPVETARWLADYLSRTADAGACDLVDDPRHLRLVQDRLAETGTLG